MFYSSVCPDKQDLVCFQFKTEYIFQLYFNEYIGPNMLYCPEIYITF
jgi:hypothetical protein